VVLIVKRILIIAYHYPPVGVSSGVHRTLKFTQYLPDLGWIPQVLTINPKAYERISYDQVSDIPRCVDVKRAFGLDTARSLSIRGRYPGIMALPDRWVSWWFGAVAQGLCLIKRDRPDVIMSTYPIATAHLIGLTLSKITGIPWVADFRDSMTEESYPTDRLKRLVYRWIEAKTVYNAEKVVFTTPGAISMYKQRYNDIRDDKWALIENGYDEEKFNEVESEINAISRGNSKTLTLVHSGLLYPSERDPSHFFKALAELKKEKQPELEGLRVILRATGHDAIFEPLIVECDINDIVKIAPPIDYSEALKEMLISDGLLVLQASNCNHQIPAKLYEYIRARRPILALTDLSGDTANVLKNANINTIVPLDRSDLIKSELLRFIQMIRSDEAPITSKDDVDGYSRKARAGELVDLINNIKG